MIKAKMTANIPLPLVEGADIYNNFFKWLDSKKAFYPKLELINKDGYRTVISKNTISNKEKIMEIPLDLIITYKKAMNSPLNRKLKGLLECEHTIFSIFLLEEKEIGDKSYWRPYIDILPPNFNNMAIYFDNSLLELLKGTLALEKIIGRRQHLKSDYDKLCMFEPTFGERFTFDDFVWGRLVTITRIFGFSIGGHKTSGLVPLADMLNHKNPDRNTSETETSWEFDDQSTSFSIVSNRNIKTGREIYDSYGFKCNSRFFVNYGFTVENNDDDDETSLFGDQFHITGFFRPTREGIEKTKNMFSTVRKTVTESDKWNRELKILYKIQSEVDHRLSEFGGDQNYYNSKLSEQGGGIDFRRRCCYMMCASELNVLKKFERMCNYLIPILSSKKFNKIIDKKGRIIKSGIPLIDEYLASVTK